MFLPILCRNTHMPSYGTASSTGLDLYANEEIVLAPGRVTRVKTGVFLAVPDGYDCQIRPRSGLAAMGIIGLLGTIDSDYRGEVEGMLYNTTATPYRVAPGDRIAQLVFGTAVRPKLNFVSELPKTVRGDGGFGSTGR